MYLKFCCSMCFKAPFAAAECFETMILEGCIVFTAVNKLWSPSCLIHRQYYTQYGAQQPQLHLK